VDDLSRGCLREDQAVGCAPGRRRYDVVTVGLWAPLEAKAGKEQELAEFLEGGRALVDQEPETTAWFAVRLGPTSFAVIDFFPDDSGRQAHLSGSVAEALLARADELLARPPEITPLDVIAAKLPG
jgi:quinol monooxygenase YgiN